jgi:tetratricopeptide (TPR) repeat protein
MYLTPPVETNVSTTQMLSEALAALDAGKLQQARDVAADLRLRTDIPQAEQGVPAYVLGAVMHQEAMDEWQERERRAYFLMAARYLDESHRAGFPRGREAQGSYLLGKSFHGCGRLTESTPHLNAALEHHPQHATEICRLLTDAFLHGHSPDLAKAAEFNQRYLADPSLGREDRDAALLTQAKITFELGQYDECGKQLEQFQAASPGYAEVLLLQGRLQVTDGTQLAKEPARKSESLEKYRLASEIFARAFEQAGRNSLIMRQAQYLQGLCLRQLGDFLAAEILFAKNRRSYLETPEGMASGIEEAELKLLLGNDSESLTAYRRVLSQIADTPTHVHPWITDEDLRRRLESVVADFRQEPQFEAAADLLQAISLVFPDSRTVESQANLHEDWGELLSKQAADPQAKDPVALRTQSRLEHRQAGVDFGRLAKLRFATREYPSDLWRSAENYLRGQDYESAAVVYRRHLENQARNRRPPALTRLGECLLALNRPEEALQYVTECIESFPKDPFVYRARLIAAEADLEMGRDQQAEELLTANLENESLTPQSREWRDSLFALGRIHYLDGSHHETASRQKGIDSSNPVEQQAGLKELELAHKSFHEAVTRLSEAVQREPEAEQAIDARYMLALAHAHSAKLPRKQLTGVHIETTRVALRRELQQELSAAIVEFDILKDLLIAKQEQGDLTSVHNRVLRNCYFGKADALFELEQFEEAIQAYSSATNRYQQEPESLEAFVQIAICQRKLNRLADSRRTLDQAKLVLGRMPTSATFEKTTRYNRQEWADLLGWLSNL